ncbi:MAG: N-acetyltransferase [Gemmatimonadota bacterium]
MTVAVTVSPVAGRADLERFLRLPWRIYEKDPLWVPPLLADVRAALNPARHPFHAHAEVATFLARRGRTVVGRIAAVVNRAHNEYHEDTLGFFGLFECFDDQAAADALLGAAEEWLRKRGMTAVQGPVNLSTNEEVCSPGVLVAGFAQPTIMMAYTPAYYATLIERAGYAGAKDLLTYQLQGREPPPRLQRAHDRLLRDERITARPLDMRRFDEEVDAIQAVYNSAWERNWGFVPMTAAEIAHMAAQLKPVVNPRLCVITEVDGEVVGFALNLPDYNIALKHVNGRLFPFGVLKLLWYRRGIDSARTLTLGLKPGFRNRGLDALMMARMFIEGNRIGIWRSECSWILEDNWDMRRALERIGGVVDKRYRVFEKPLYT